VRLAQQGIPQRLSPGELNSVTGHLDWPAELKGDEFSAERAKVERLLVGRSEQGALKPAEYRQLRELTDQMLAELKAEIKSMDPEQYVRAKKFIQKVAYEARFPTS